MPILPHNFPLLRRDGNGVHHPSMLTIGVGMSFGLAPMPPVLLADKRASAEAKLHCGTSHAADDLYKWADEIMAQLVARGDPIPKLTLAQSLDIPFESRWPGTASARRNTPRHRVIARFAREGLWEQIWSLNWDCIQESALENVGIKRDGVDAGLSWPTGFRTFITAAECPQMAEENRVKVVKPHGCVMALVTADAARRGGDQPRARQLAERFLITATERANLAPGAAGGGAQQFIFATLCVKLSSCPFVIAGWSVSEEYLLNYIEKNVQPLLAARPLAVDELSIIDIAFNHQGHTRLAGFYNKDEATAHVPVEPGGFTTDKLFLWIQALYAIGCLHRCASDADKPALGEIAAPINQPPDAPVFLTSWVDNFLPVWVRLCRKSNYEPISADNIDLESRDEHIPWNFVTVDRPDLAAAAALLALLHRSGHAGNWDYEMFPGALYRDNRLVIPLPGWHTAPPNDLRGLKALIDAIKQPGAGYIDRLGILPLPIGPAAAIPPDTKLILKELVARDLAMARFATGATIEEVDFGDL